MFYEAPQRLLLKMFFTWLGNESLSNEYENETMHTLLENFCPELPTFHPDVYDSFLVGNFSVQLSDNTFERNEGDNTIENIVNKDKNIWWTCTMQVG